MLKTNASELSTLDMKQCHFFLQQPSDLDALPSPRVLATHRQFHDLPSDFIIKKRKLVLVVRDPKDVCVSIYNAYINMKIIFEYSGTFDGFLSLFLQGKGKFIIMLGQAVHTRYLLYPRALI